MDLLKSDVVKIILTCVAAVAGTLILYYPPPNQIGVYATVITSILGALGIVSGGVRAAQPKPPEPPTP